MHCTFFLPLPPSSRANSRIFSAPSPALQSFFPVPNLAAFLLSLRFSSPLKISAAPRLICTGRVARFCGDVEVSVRAAFAVRRTQAEVRGSERVRTSGRIVLN